VADIDLYVAGTPNGQRAVVALEEMGLAYDLHKLDLTKGDQKKPEYLAINPHGRIPCIVDKSGPKPIVMTQSWAICVYLAEKTGKFIPKDPVGRMKVLEWMFHIATDVMAIHSAHGALQRNAPDKSTANIAWAEDRVRDALAYLDRRLSGQDYFAGEISIADLAFYPVWNRRRGLAQENKMTNLLRWGAAMDARPGCKRALEIVS
jgi:GST-like protein